MAFLFSGLNRRFILTSSFISVNRRLLRFCKLLLSSAVFFMLPADSLYAQSPSVASATDIYAQLKKLNVLGSVLYIAAHPDDENNQLLPYLAKEKKYRTAYLSLTRGDGGQNLIGPEQGIELGLIRTQELIAARRVDGAEQFFSSAYEFGFSKTADETLKIWDKEKVLADMVWVIRKFQPDIIINRFPGDARAGHGHHAASAILSQEAFIAAADPKRFPEQLKLGVEPWQAKRLLWNTFNFGGANTTSDLQLKIDAGVFNPLLGRSYGEIGGEARSMHKSQGEGRPRRKGSIYEYFVTLAGDSAKKDLMDGVVTDWSRVPGEGAAMKLAVDQLIANFDFEHPEKSVEPLVALYKSLQRMNEHGNWWYKKKQEIEELIMACSGVFAEATTDVEYAVPGEKLAVNFLVNKRTAVNLKLDQVSLNTAPENAFDSALNLVPATNVNWVFAKQFLVEPGKKYTQPFWLEKPLNNSGNFLVDVQQLTGNDESGAAFLARFVFSINGISFIVNRPVQYKYVDPVRGEVYQPLTVIPQLVLSLNKNVVLTNVSGLSTERRNSNKESLLLQCKSNISAAAVPVTVRLLGDDRVVYTLDTTMSLEAGAVYGFPISLSVLSGGKQLAKLTAEIIPTLNGKQLKFTQYLQSIKYDHIPSIHYLYKDQVQLVNEQVKTIPKRVGYIIGAGDLVPEALEQLGYAVEFLREADITDAQLKKFDVIVVGIRAYNIHEWLTTKNEILNRFVENGGHLVAQYMKSNQVGLKKIKAGPYPFSMSGVRVTEENARVNFVLKEHAFLNMPNKITDSDFEGWVQERSTYQADEAMLKAPFEAVLSMNDQNEKPSSGSLVTAKYGKGHFTYVSLVLFRQLPAGVPGGYRLLANIISLPADK